MTAETTEALGVLKTLLKDLDSNSLTDSSDAERVQAAIVCLEAAEARVEALEAECHEERAQRQMAEDEVQRLREAIEKHRGREWSTKSLPYSAWDDELYAALTQVDKESAK